jgi:hypothetical protein
MNESESIPNPVNPNFNTACQAIAQQVAAKHQGVDGTLLSEQLANFLGKNIDLAINPFYLPSFVVEYIAAEIAKSIQAPKEEKQ